MYGSKYTIDQSSSGSGIGRSLARERNVRQGAWPESVTYMYSTCACKVKQLIEGRCRKLMNPIVELMNVTASLTSSARWPCWWHPVPAAVSLSCSATFLPSPCRCCDGVSTCCYAQATDGSLSTFLFSSVFILFVFIHVGHIQLISRLKTRLHGRTWSCQKLRQSLVWVAYAHCDSTTHPSKYSSMCCPASLSFKLKFPHYIHLHVHAFPSCSFHPQLMIVSV